MNWFRNSIYRRASSTSSLDTASPLERHSRRIPALTRSHSPAHQSPAKRSFEPPRATSSACHSNLEESRPTLSSPTPISTPRYLVRPWECSATPVRFATRVRAVFVERPIYDEFVARMSEFAESLVVGNSMDPATEIGPVVSQAQLARVIGYLDIGKERRGADYCRWDSIGRW